MSQTNYTALTVQTGQVTGTLTNFPVGILFASLNRLRTIANGGNVANANGYDIRPYADVDLTSPLTYELVAYDPTTGLLEMYVKVPSLADGYVIYLGYGDTALTTDGSSSATWNSNFKAVYHFGNATTLSLNDSTSNANHLTNQNSATRGSPITAGSSIALATASSQHATSATPAVTALPITMSALVIANNFDANREIVCMNPTAANQSGVDLQARNAGPVFRALQNSPSVDSATVSASTWYHVAGRYVSTTDRNIVVNGTNTQNTTSSSLNTPNQICVGAFKSNGAASGFLDGRIDELRISDVDRSVDWLTAESNNLRAFSSFMSTGAEQAFSGGGGPTPPALTATFPVNPVPHRPGPGGFTGGTPFAQSRENPVPLALVAADSPPPFRMLIPMRPGPGGLMTRSRSRFAPGGATSTPVPPVSPPGVGLLQMLTLQRIGD